jgi:hypothetical protein
MRITSPELIFVGCFTDRDRGERFVLSAFRLTSWAGKGKHIITYSVYARSYRCMEGKLFRMCQNIGHVYKQSVNWIQMYNNN